MRDLKRNKQLIHFKNIIKTVEIIDENGNGTGSFQSIYGDMQELYINISASKGVVNANPFGAGLQYDKILLTSLNLDINEYSVFWIDETDLTKPHDYIISKIARSLNHIQYAVKRLNLS